jgi:glutamate--cysteine ligase catalytic subunit
MRRFVTSHPAYKQDSVISPEIAHDLLVRCKGIGEGSIPCPEILGDIVLDRYVCLLLLLLLLLLLPF